MCPTRATILIDLKEPSLSLQSSETGLQHNSSSHELHMTRGMALKEVGEKEKAKEAFRTSLKINPNFMLAVKKLALMYSVDEEHQLALPL